MLPRGPMEPIARELPPPPASWETQVPTVPAAESQPVEIVLVSSVPPDGQSGQLTAETEPGVCSAERVTDTFVEFVEDDDGVPSAQPSPTTPSQALFLKPPAIQHIT